jgi:hypothetical protein
VDSRAALSLLSIPLGIQGAMVGVTETGFEALYTLSLSSAAPIDGTSVLATSLGGTSRWLRIGGGGAGTTPAVVFDDSVLGTNQNIRSNVTDPAALNNARTGIVSFGHDTMAVASLGVTGNYATCTGGDMPSVTGDYATGGGYRPNAYGIGSTAFGYSSFADGDACSALGRSCVAGATGSMTGSPNITFTEVGATGDTITRSVGSFVADGFTVGCRITVTGSASNNISDALVTNVTALVLTLDTADLANEGPVGGVSIAYQTQNATVAGRQNQARGPSSTAFGELCIIDQSASHAFSVGNNCLIGPAALRGVAMGNQATANGLDSIAIGPATTAGGEGSVALGYHNTAAGDTACALGQSCSSSGNAAFTAGRICTAEAQSAFAIGDSCNATGSYSGALGRDADASGESSLALGQGSRATRVGEHARGAWPNASGPSGMYKRNFLKATSTNGSTQNLLAPNSAELTLDDTKSYHFKIHVLASRTDSADAGAVVIRAVGYTSGGAFTIVNQTTDYSVLSAGWSVVLSSPGGLTFRLACTGAAGQTVEFDACVTWTEATGASA